MQLYALDDEGNPVFASNALKGLDYLCCECLSHVRLREGPHRRAHFYHHHPSSVCRQNGKSLTHLQIQYYFQDLLLIEGAMEVPFPSIKRIADIVWEKEKIVFEIQCSPISAEEVMQRNRDYASLGYQVVWILHDQRFNKNRATAAELWLQDHPHYFTDMDETGNGMIYDQWSHLEKGYRHQRSELLTINISGGILHRLSQKLSFRKEWKIHFVGDLIDTGKIKIFDFQEGRKTFVGLSSPLQSLKKFYRILFRHLLEKACR